MPRLGSYVNGDENLSALKTDMRGELSPLAGA
jgi:hypothetical protein